MGGVGLVVCLVGDGVALKVGDFVPKVGLGVGGDIEGFGVTTRCEGARVELSLITQTPLLHVPASPSSEHLRPSGTAPAGYTGGP